MSKGYQVIRISEGQDIRILGYQVLSPDIPIPRYPVLPLTWYPDSHYYE